MSPEPVPPEPASPAREGTRRWSPITHMVLLGGVWLAVSAVFALQTSALGFLPWSLAAALALLDWGPWILLSPLVLFLARKMPIGPKTWAWAVPAHTVLSVLLVILIETAMTSLPINWEIFRPYAGRSSGPTERSAGERTERPPSEPRFRERSGRPRLDPQRLFWLRVAARARLAIPVYWLLLAVAYAVAQQRRSNEREARALKAEAHLSEARLMALQAQLNPHFLFNTLNTITQLVYDNPAAAEEMITSLSDLLRAVLASQHRPMVPLSEEIAFVEKYGAIQRARFSDRLKINYEIHPDALRGTVPTLLLQPLVENAVIHGVAPEVAPGSVFVRARRDGEWLRLEVADTGSGAGQGALASSGPLRFKEGIGVGNTRSRLQSLYGQRHSIELVRAAEGGVSARISLPYREAAI